MRNNQDRKEWKQGDMDNNMLMVCGHLSSSLMTTERKDISWYGAVRMTKAEAAEMIALKVRYQNFWVYVTVYNESDGKT